MKRMMLGVVASLLALSLSAAPSQDAGAPVIVKNTPLEVSLTAIPEWMDQRRPIDVHVAGEAAVDLHQLDSQFLGVDCAVTIAQGDNHCDTSEVYIHEGPPAFIRMVSFLPFPYRSYPDKDFTGLSCHGIVYISVNEEPFIPVLDSTWSPSNLASTHVVLPMPIIIPPAPEPGTKVKASLRLLVANGGELDGCSAQVKLWSSPPTF